MIMYIHSYVAHVLYVIYSARNNRRPLAIFQPISTFGRPKSILVGHIYCTFSMGWKLITYKNVPFSKMADQFLTLISTTVIYAIYIRMYS